MRLVLFTLIAGALVSQSVGAAEITGPQITKQEFFSLLDYTVPGLSGVRDAAEADDYDKAAAALLEYMRARRSVKYFIDSSQKPAAANPDYDTTKADDICNHIFHGGISDWYPPYQLGEKIDWGASPYNDREWHWGINRHPHWTILGEAYWATVNEKYAVEFVKQLTDWVTSRPVVTDGSHNSSVSWRTIEAGLRMGSAWPSSYQYFLNSPNFTPEAHLLFLRSMVDHARHLEKHPTGINWVTMEMSGLLHVAVLFPEFKESERWRKFALDRLNKELNAQVYPDGMQFELTTGYHCVALDNFAEPLKLLELNGITVPAEYDAALRRMYEALIHMVKPCGYLPAFNDSDAHIETDPQSGKWADARSILKEGASRYNRPDMLYAATSAKEGKPPTHASHAFDYAGYYVMRQGWDRDDLYLVFDAGPLGAAHQHEDKLSFEAYAFGETLLYDPGRYSYADRVFGPHIRSTWAHNTCVVNGLCQSRMSVPPEQRKWVTDKPLNNPWITTAEFDYAEGVYDEGYGSKRDRSVIHRRGILFVKNDYWFVVDRFEGAGEHTIDTLFHFAPGKVRVDDTSLACSSANAGRPGVMIVPSATGGVRVEIQEGSESPCQGWISTEYNSKVAAPVADYHFEGPLPAEFAYLLHPFKSSAPRAASVCRLDLTLGGKTAPPGPSAYEIKLDNGRIDLILLAHSIKGDKRFGSIETDAEVAIIRTDTSGKVVMSGSYGGTYIRSIISEP